jgi:hypothetical protein
MLQPKRISSQQKVFDGFRKITGLSHFLRPEEKLLLWAFYAVIFLTWAVCAALVYQSHHFPDLLPPLPPFGERGARILSSLWWSLIFALPVWILCFFAFSGCMRNLLKRRGIIVKGWLHWRGADIERKMLDEFRLYLVEGGFANPAALEQLMSSARDEIAAKERPSKFNWTMFTFIFTIAIAFVQPVINRFLQLSVNSSGVLWQLFGLACLLIIAIIEIALLLSGVINLRAEGLEIYLHSLTAIRLGLLSGDKRRRTGASMRSVSFVAAKGREQTGRVTVMVRGPHT